MGALKKILVTIPEPLLEKADAFAASENINRSQFIRDAMVFYLREIRKTQLRKQMIEGYQAMAEINVEIAEGGVHADYEAHVMYEKVISEM